MATISEELREYAEFMSVDLIKEQYLQPLLKRGISAPLPEGWTYEEEGDDLRYTSPDGRILHEHPIDEEIRQDIEMMRPHNVTAEISFRDPTDEEVQQTLSYFGIAAPSSDQLMHCVAFMRGLPAGWRVFEFQNCIFFNNGAVSEYSHPGERDFRDWLDSCAAKKLLEGEFAVPGHASEEELTPEKTGTIAGDGLKEEELRSTAVSAVSTPSLPVVGGFSQFRENRDSRDVSTQTDIIDNNIVLGVEYERLRQVQQEFDAQLTKLKDEHILLVQLEVQAYQAEIGEIREQHRLGARELLTQGALQMKEALPPGKASGTIDNITAAQDEETGRLEQQLVQYEKELAQYQKQAFELQQAFSQIRSQQGLLFRKDACIKQLERELSDFKKKESEKPGPLYDLILAPARREFEETKLKLERFKAEIDTLICNFGSDLSREASGIRYIDAEIADYNAQEERNRRLLILCDVLEYGINFAGGNHETAAVASTLHELLWAERRKTTPARDKAWVVQFRDKLRRESSLISE